MKYKIWSFEHNQWWKHGSSGYTEDINNAGIYSLEVATEIAILANKYSNKLEEAIVPVEE